MNKFVVKLCVKLRDFVGLLFITILTLLQQKRDFVGQHSFNQSLHEWYIYSLS